MKPLAEFIMRGRMQAIIAIAGFAILSMMFPLASLLSAAGLGLITLRLGARESVGVMVASAVVVGVTGALLTGNAVFALIYGLILWLPVWPIAILLRASRQLSLTIECALAVCVAAVFLIYLSTNDPAQAWQAHLHNLAALMQEKPQFQMDADQVAKGIDAVSHYVTGLIAAGAFASLTAGLLLARWWQSILFNPGGFRSEFVALRLHSVLSYLALLLVAGAYLGGDRLPEIAWNLGSPFIVIFVITGLAILHSILGTKRIGLVSAYIALFFIPHLMVPVVFVGWSDAWLDWRKRTLQFRT